MSGQYANKQPEGFVNKIRTVAVIGASGNTGKFFTEHLLKTGRHIVTAVSRVGSKAKCPEGARVVNVDYDDEESLLPALTGQDFLIITLAITAPEETNSKLINAAVKAGVPYVMPNTHSINFWNSESLRNDIAVGNLIMARIKQVKDAGLTCISLFIGFWYEHSIAMGDGGFGIDVKTRTAVFFDDGNKAVNTSTWDQCGRGLAALASLKRLPENEGDKSVTLVNFHDRPAFVSSFKINQKNMLKSVQRVTGTSDADWSVSYRPSSDRYAEGGKDLEQGIMSGFYKQMYARVFYPIGDADYESDNALLGLSDEDLDEATRAGIKLAKAGYSY